MANRYWVPGGSGNWDTNTNNWSASSGGASGASVPTLLDNVFFDGNSGAGIVYLNTVDQAKALNLDFTGFTGTLKTFRNVQVAGNLKFSTTMHWDFSSSSSSSFDIQADCNLTSNGNAHGCGLIMNTPGITVTLQDDFVGNNASLNIIKGTFNANNKNVTCASLSSNGTNTRTITMGSGLWTLHGDLQTLQVPQWQIDQTTGLTFNKNTANIKFTAPGAGTILFNSPGLTYNDVWFAVSGFAVDITISGANTFATLKDNGDTAHNFTLPNDITTCTTPGGFIVTGNSGQLITVKRTGGSGFFTISIASGVVSCDYMSISNSLGTGGAYYFAGAHSTDGGGNTNWVFSAPTMVILTDAVSAIKTTAATGNGNVVYEGPNPITQRGIVWSLSPNPTTADFKVIVAGTTGAYSGALSGLTPNTTYYVRAYAITGAGTNYGNQVTFTSGETVVITNPVTDIHKVTPPVGHGNVADSGGETITERGLVWDTSPDPTTADSKIIVAGTTGVFEGPLAGLSPDTTYYVRAYAITAIGTTYGDNVSFLSKSALTKVGVLDTGNTDFDDPIYFEVIDRWRAFTDMYAKSKSISGLNMYTENAAGVRIYFQSKKSPPNVWESLGTVDQESNSLFPNASTDDFEVGRIRVAGFTSGDPVVVQGIEILSLNVKGFDQN